MEHQRMWLIRVILGDTEDGIGGEELTESKDFVDNCHFKSTCLTFMEKRGVLRGKGWGIANYVRQTSQKPPEEKHDYSHCTNNAKV
jgi:hypothetical protein